MTLDVRKLHVLCDVTARGTLAAAAEALGYTPSAISQQMAALDRETSSNLLERGPGGVRLMEAGKALVAHAKVILERLAQAEAELRRSQVPAPHAGPRGRAVARLADRRSSTPKENMIAVLREVASSFGGRNGKLRSVG